MKKTLLAFSALILLAACNKEENHGDTNVHITGTIKSFKKGKLFIQRFNDSAFVNIDTIVVDGNPSFESHLKLESPEMLYLVIDRVSTNSVDDNLPFFAEPGNITINTSKDEFFGKAKITGSKNQKLYEEFLKINSRFVGENLELEKSAFMAGTDAKKQDSIALKKEAVKSRRYLYTINFARNHGDHEVAPYLALSEIGDDINLIYLDTVQNNMTPKVAQSRYGKLLNKLIADRKKQAPPANE